jgi:hypothetical protein
MLTLLMTTSVSLAEIDVDVEDPATGGEATELSIAPLDHVDYPSDRPQWINQSSEGQQNDEETILISVVSPPQPTPDAAAEMMEVMTRGVVENYIDQKASLVREPIDSKKIEVEMDWIRDELITRRYDGEVKVGEHTQYESACLLSLTLDHQETLDRLIENHQLMHRFGVVGVFALGGFHSLVGGSIVFGGLASRQQRRQAT